jgi:hypothetical protein
MICDDRKARWARRALVHLFVAWALLGVVSCERGPGDAGRVIKTRTVTTQIGERTAVVRIIWSRNRGVRFGHGHFGGGDWKFDVRVSFEDGKNIEFTVTSSKPAAIWRHDGVYYLACSSGDGPKWFFANLDEDGNLTQIRKKDLPKGEIDWNLVDPQWLVTVKNGFEFAE